MKIEEAIEILERHNEWRRGAEIPQESPEIIGEAIDYLVHYAKIEEEFKKFFCFFMKNPHLLSQIKVPEIEK